MNVELGIIEGFYGKPWSWDERKETVAFLAPHGYAFYLYAPKADVFLRRRWREDHPQEEADRLKEMSSRCRAMGVRMGVGLSPYELYLGFDDDAREALGRKLDFLQDVGIDDLAILFDDMRGDTPDLAETQVEIVEWVAGRSAAERTFICPSYYSDDPVLDRAFGTRPEAYVEQLGSLLDPAIQIFWTGEEVISRELSPRHLSRVTEQLARKPFLWDNYPVNDGQRMSQYLHLRGFTGRPSVIASHIAGHGINPALQPVLTRIPALTLRESYERGGDYSYTEAFRGAAKAVMGDQLAERLWEDLLILQDVGLDRLGEKEQLLRDRWQGSDHSAAREIIAWLDGEYRITHEIVETQ
ncbi:beta-N-acetylglucosaminidase domain-containing protein [soil metagenome]